MNSNQAKKTAPPGQMAAAGWARSGGRDLFRRLRLVLGFFTILPWSCRGSLEELATASFLLPVVAAFLGLLEGVTGWIAFHLFGQLVAAAIVLALALLLTGFHHADGLADVGDALMVHGSTNRRIEVLKDKALGMGAAGTLLVVYLISWSALAQLVSIHGGASFIFFMMAVEVSARFSLLLTAGISTPSHSGSGSVFLAALKGQRLALAIAIALIILGILTVVIGTAAVGAVVAYTVLIALLVIVVAKHAFGGTGGDVLGASVELGRMAALLALITTF